MYMKDNKHILYIPLYGIVDNLENLIFKANVIGSLLEIKKRRDYIFVMLDDKGSEEVKERLALESIVFDDYTLCSNNDIAYLVFPDKTEKRVDAADILHLDSWKDIASYLVGDELLRSRRCNIKRETAETSIAIDLDLDGCGKGIADTKLPFFDHMLSQLIKHSRCNLNIKADGDVEIDEHHTVEDIAITLGEAVLKAIGDKRGIERYGFEVLMMDDVVVTVSLDFSGRVDFIYDVDFRREYVGTFPTELFKHFFRSFSDSAKCNLYIGATEGGDAHHTAEGMYKAFARAMRKAVRRIPGSSDLPSTKGVL